MFAIMTFVASSSNDATLHYFLLSILRPDCICIYIFSLRETRQWFLRSCYKTCTTIKRYDMYTSYGIKRTTLRIGVLMTNRYIGRLGDRHTSGPSVDSRNLFFDRWSDVFFRPPHESRVSSTLWAISANNATASNGINPMAH